MSTCRMYGDKPYRVAVVHGGPGAAGTMKECARLLASNCGVLEPIQTADSVEGQIEELRDTLDKYAELPVILIGHSWGAMLGYLFSARYPEYVKKLFMVCSGVYDPKYAKDIMETRLNRLNDEKKILLNDLITKLEENCENPDVLFHQVGKLIEEADSFDPIKMENSHIIEGQYHIYKHVWPQAEKMRAAGEFQAIGKNIRCPVFVIHGKYDPHPYEGVQEPLSKILSDVTFILLDKCGHEPWLERQARENFFNIIKQYLEG